MNAHVEINLLVLKMPHCLSFIFFSFFLLLQGSHEFENQILQRRHEKVHIILSSEVIP